MKRSILVMNADRNEFQDLSALLMRRSYSALRVESPGDLRKKLEADSFVAVLLDIDSTQMDNRTIHDLASKFPAVHFLCMSKDSFHPELQDAISRHIYACLSKPVDPEELFYWLKCIQEDDKGI
ncbi:MAG: response regulator [Desulfobacteraceae bacterium]|nr:MAG: response regulator [Desulfobacteraceae bacterium]